MEIYFETYGCTANQNNTEIMKGLVRQAGLNITENEDFADFIVINTCIVKTPTEEKIRRRICEFLKKRKKIIVAGCMPGPRKNKLNSKNLFLLDAHNCKNIINLIKDIIGNKYNFNEYLKERNEVKLNLPKISQQKTIGITQLSEGCLGNCVYCIVKFAKGKLFSYPKEKIIQNIKSDLTSGVKEIWLTSQDNASYGNEQEKYLLPELLKRILDLPGKFYVRLGMMNPNNILNILPQLIGIYKHKKIFKFLHLPIQSGSDKILKAMNRKYKTKNILKIINEFKKQIPDITISTDIIVGYPDERDEDFKKTLDLIKKIKPDVLNISKFWAIKGTQAGKLENQLSVEITKKRATELMNLHKEIASENNKKWLGWQGEVFVDKLGFENTYLARNNAYKLIIIRTNEKILGKFVKVKITKTMPHYLIGEITK